METGFRWFLNPLHIFNCFFFLATVYCGGHVEQHNNMKSMTATALLFITFFFPKNWLEFPIQQKTFCETNAQHIVTWWKHSTQAKSSVVHFSHEAC